jgi:hypothetical protein
VSPRAPRHHARHSPGEGSGVAMCPGAPCSSPGRRRLRSRHTPRGSRPTNSAPRGPAINIVSNLVVDVAGPTGSIPQGAHHRRCLQTWWWTLPDSPAALPKGPAIDIIFNLGGGCCRTRWQCPQGAHHRRCLLNLVADAAGPTGNTPQGARHRRLIQPGWWSLPDSPTPPPIGGSTIDVFNLGGGHCLTCRQRPPGDPPSTSSPTSMVDTAGPIDSVPRGPPSMSCSNW